MKFAKQAIYHSGVYILTCLALKANPAFDSTFSDIELSGRGYIIISPASKADDSGEFARNVLTAINISLVGYFFWLAQKNRRKEDADKQRKTTSAFWYQKIIIEPNLPRVISFFDSCKTTVSAYEKALAALNTAADRDKLLVQSLAEISTKKRELVGNLVHSLHIVDNDMATKFGKMLDEAQDSVSEGLDQGIDINRLATILDASKVQLLSSLYNSHIETCELRPSTPSFLRRLFCKTKAK